VEAKAVVTRPGIAPAQHIVDYVASMFTAARTSGRQRQRLPTRPGIAPAQHIVDYGANMFTATRT
jgi:hypothetical protein